MKARTRATRTTGRTGVGLALAATTVAAMTVPAGAATMAPVTTATAGATALALPAPHRALPASSYQVRAGDTVSAIAARAGTSVSAIVAANNLGPAALIKAGQVLRLPSSGGAPAPARPAAATTHTVAAGDTVSALAKRYGTTVAQIVSANRLGSRALIIVGQRLTIPGTAPASGAGPSGGAPSSGGSSSGPTAARAHVVRSGDTVSGLATQYGTTVAQIVSANGLRNAGLIHIGQRLTIPGTSGGAPASRPATPATTPVSNPAAGARTHVVRSGETLSVLATTYGTSVSAIVKRNNLRSASLIYVGQQLAIPGSTGGASSPAGQLVGDTFLGRTYARDVVSAANTNKATLVSMEVPSRDRMRAMVRDTAVRMGVDPALALAIAQQESGFDARAVSPANAVGAMQVIPSSGDWASELVGRRLNLLDPQDNVTAGVAILRQLVRTADNLDQAVAGYYQGLAGVRRNGMYADTRNYVAGIKNLMRQF
ncbi:LysM peptidoglycan-binding domain-containing protein [Georgenia sp. H159]|uniref:LysM peptidoglycan-binding domain-containing protein n=1 Tax=Georgenia sp. H159 TaxID=3076115 RepID=UPI002D794E16|nr:LysM peptidoglycan-binding domain-containing protein [Georgenia sp. H159]